ncbi:hypothetical protein AArcSl_1663 [Halalkaliarchaeum desulfuricum]|uniref:DUF3267 domain-containing protein n=1 Tax=Halalkaliarchaeum desulfuricum TaxID=2055893 RepID=A0A343TJM0_9EURY|nr:DUF3267 domain-containing protein [Halalkaliarchaeum desulfuricum]AUX09292.1 hypothetical protein AArcSl_1663 [Halalkaliarchaeum desulfuricum]
MSDHPDEELLAQFGLSRSLVLQWTVVSTIGFLISVVGFLVLYFLVTGDDTAMSLSLGIGIESVWWWNLALSFVTLVAVMALVIVPHELCHGIAIKAYGGQPRYGMGVAYFVFPYAFATTETRFSRNQFLVIALAPLVVLTLIGIPVMILFEWPWLAVPLALNAGGAVGDVWMALLLLSYPSEVSVLDSTTGLEIYGPPGLDRWDTAPATVVWDLLVGFAGSVLIVALIVGVLVPFVLAALGVGSVLLGIPDSPLFIFEFSRTPDGVEFSAGPGIVIIGAILGLLYGYTRARQRGNGAS